MNGNRSLITSLILLLLAGMQIQAAELVTDRPDQTESSSVVPAGTIQIETGLVYGSDENKGTEYSSLNLLTTLLRVGILSSMELRLGTDYTIETTDYGNIQRTFEGLSPIYLGTKIAITEESGLLPEMAFLFHLTFENGSKYFRPHELEPDFRMAFSHTLSERLGFGYNIGAEWSNGLPIYVYSAAFGYSLTGDIGIFVEWFGDAPEGESANHLLDAGATYLILPILQADVSAGIAITGQSQDYFLNAGLSLRLPR